MLPISTVLWHHNIQLQKQNKTLKTTENYVLMPLFIYRKPKYKCSWPDAKMHNDLELSSFIDHNDFEGIKSETHKGLKK